MQQVYIIRTTDGDWRGAWRAGSEDQAILLYRRSLRQEQKRDERLVATVEKAFLRRTGGDFSK
jgi:predicted Zn-dependent protease with MMP-like domain